MNSQEEQHLTWNEPTAYESLVMIVSELIQYDIVHGTTYVIFIPIHTMYRIYYEIVC